MPCFGIWQELPDKPVYRTTPYVLKTFTTSFGDADDEQDDDSYLSDHSTRKGKAPASRKRRMSKEKASSNTSSKRIKTAEPIDLTHEEDIEIDEERSSPRAIKAEPIGLTQTDDIEIDEERSCPRAIKSEPIDLTYEEDIEIDEERSSPRGIKAEPIDLI